MSRGISKLLEYRKDSLIHLARQFTSSSAYWYEAHGESVKEEHYGDSVRITWETNRGKYIIYFDTESRFGCDYCFYYVAGSESYEWNGWVINGKFKSFIEADPVPDLVDIRDDILRFLHGIVIKKYQNYQS